MNDSIPVELGIRAQLKARVEETTFWERDLIFLDARLEDWMCPGEGGMGGGELLVSIEMLR